MQEKSYHMDTRADRRSSSASDDRSRYQTREQEQEDERAYWAARKVSRPPANICKRPLKS
jgi:hypothetical protein